ncbi:MAG: hypothetical protein AAFZ65_12335, partial [Planctomycetota bacterium]
GLPTSTVDALAATDGLLAAVLGGTLDLDLGATPDLASGAFDLEFELRSPIAEVTALARMADGALVSAGGGPPLYTSFALTPLSSPRVVGPLIPFLSTVETVPGGERASLSLSDFRLPLDGDLSSLSGDLILGLGDVRVRWIPGLSGLAGFEDERLGPYRFSLRDGRATYTDMPISVDGERFPLTGSVGLADRSLELSAELPLRTLGRDVVEFAGLEGLGDTRVPITLGRQPNGQVQVDLVDADLLGKLAREQLEATVERELDEVLRKNEDLDEARKTLKKLLGGGFGGLLGGNREDG